VGSWQRRRRGSGCEGDGFGEAGWREREDVSERVVDGGCVREAAKLTSLERW
jgi:hypothetical protein